MLENVQRNRETGIKKVYIVPQLFCYNGKSLKLFNYTFSCVVSRTVYYQLEINMYNEQKR